MTVDIQPGQDFQAVRSAYLMTAKIGEFASVKSGTGVPTANIHEERSDVHPFPCFGGNGVRGFVAEASHSGESVIVGRVGARCGNVHHYAGDHAATEHAIVIQIRDGEQVDGRWLYHLLARMNLRQLASAGAQPVINAGTIRDLEIELPEFRIQKSIAETLDTFTALEAELEAELKARTTQYEETRNRLMAFDDVEHHPLSRLIRELCPEGVPHLALDVVFTLRGGYTPSKSIVEYWDAGTVPWFRMEDIRENGRVLVDSLQKISAEAVKGGELFEPGSLILSTSATIGEHAMVTVPFIANQRFTVLTLREKFRGQLLEKFGFYLGFEISKWCLQNTNLSGFASVNTVALRAFQVPLPPIEVQLEVVRILDAFDSLVSDLSSGLPAEIAARRKQYEYYRDKLLSFEDVAE